MNIKIEGVELDERDLAILAKKLEDPVFFANKFLGIRTWSGQERFLRACAENRQVAHKSGHKVSKSHSLAILALWWPYTKPNARVPITASAFHQVQNIVWREVRAMYYGAKKNGIDLGGEMYRDPASGWKLPNGNESFGFSTNEPEKAAGISGGNILYLVDEASGTDDRVFEALEGNMASGASMVLTSQATKTSGMFYDCFHDNSSYWTTITTSCYDSPNITGEMDIPGLARLPWCEQKKLEWGEDSAPYQVRVLGNFPGQAHNAVIGLSLIDDAIRRYEKTKPDGPLRIGVDVARFGDDETVIQPVRGHKALPNVVKYGLNGREVAGVVIDLVQDLIEDDDEVVIVNVDSIGLGASPIDFLDVMGQHRDDLRIRCVPVNVSNVSDQPKNYAELRTQMCFDLRDWLLAGGSIPREDQRLKQEIVSPTYEIDTKGRHKLDPKKKEKENLQGKSPDRRNALELAIYDSRPRRTIGGSHVYI